MLGTDLVETFSVDHEVIGIARHPSNKSIVKTHAIDLIDEYKVMALLAEEKPDLVIHAAAMTDVDGCQRNAEEVEIQNVRVTRNVLDACEVNKAFLMFFSSDYVFAGDKESQYHESDEVGPLSIYGQSKVKAEALITEGSAAYCIFRLSWLFGLNGKSFPRTIAEKAKITREFKVVNDQLGRPTWTLDIAKALHRVLNEHPNWKDRLNKQIFHLGSEGSCTWYEFTQFILKHIGKDDSFIEPITSEELNRDAPRPKNSVLSLEKAKKDLGITLRPWQEAAADFLNALSVGKENEQ